MPRRRGSGRSAARGRAPTATADNGKKSRNFQENTSSRSRSSSSSASSRPTSTKPTPAPPPPAPPPVEPVEQRWEEEAGMYKHKKFKKMASSVVVTSVTTPVPQATPIHTVAPPLLQATPTLSFQPLKHSALSLISAAEEPSPIENSRKNVCPYCNISCAKPSVLDKHIRTHTNERPYPCTPCQIAFKTQSNLYKHCRSRTHALKVDKGIDSSSVEMVAELGESFKEELEQRLPMLDAVQKLQKSSNAAVLIREEPRDLSSANKIPSFLQRPMTFLPQQPQQQQPQRRLPNGISLTNSVELTQPRPANDYVQQRIDKVISQNQAIVETLDPLWPRRYMRQNSKDQPGLEPAVSMVTVEKARNKISSGQVTMSLVQSQPKVQQHNPSLVVVRQPQDQPQNHEADILNAKSVKELWIRMSNDQQDKVQQSEGAMIKELLLKRRGATTLEPASMASIPNERRDSNSSSSSNSSNQIHAVLQVTKSSFDPQQVKLALPNVSLIRTSPQVVTSMMSKARFLPSGLISTPSAQVQAPPEFLKCNLCQKTFSGIDLELHQREYCPAVPRKHGLIMEPSDHHSPLKKPRLTILSQNQQNQQVKSILNNSAGGIVTVSKAPLQQTNMNSGGLLQIAKPIVSSTQVNKIEAKNIISSTSIAGIPVPNLAGVLTGIKPASTQTLFSLPGKISQPLQIPGIPGPSKEAASTIQPALEIKPEIKIEISKSASEADSGKFLRPNSLPLTPGSFKTKKHVMLSGGDTLVSPETPRPRKSYMLQYQNGTAYTTLGFKSSTKVYYTTIFHQQPMYVANKPRISMYSNWRVVTKDSHPSGLSPGQSLNAYNSNSSGLDQNGLFASAGVGRQSNVSDNMIVSHSSKWKAVKEAAKVEKAEKAEKAQKPTTSTSTSATPSGVARTVEGGYKSLDDDYTYVRGRGRGRYVCNACGIRCKKPSMLKKHIRTHTNFRPYTCKHCNFAFKTKGNLTKHMKSKTHHKKCVELGISPIPTTVPDDYTGSMDQGPGPSDLNNANKPVAGDSDTEDEDMEEEEEEDEDQFEDAESDVEIIGEDNGMVSKGLLPYRPKLGLTYPYNMKRSEAETVSTAASVTSGDNLVVSAAAAVACSSSTSLQPISSQAPVLGEKYYFSKSPISNDVAKAAAETVMAIASSALNASASPVASLTAKSETKPVTVLSFINDNKTESGLQAYLQAKAIKASSQTLAPIPEEQATPQRIGSLTIERASSISNDHSQGPRNVTMNVMDMPASARLPTPKATVHLPQDIQLISVSQKQQPPQPQTVASVKSTHESMMTSPPNKTLAEAIKAEANNEEVKQSTSSNGGKFVCNVCKKDFPTNALLNIHTKIHYFERPYRCDACAVSFRTHGHLQKHKRSSGHFNKVNINETFGAPSTSNPRPFYCGDCKIGFRIHGHLAKHLRSKSHIMKLENSGKLPIGMFAEMERLGTNLNEIDTSDCDTSLASLKQMAARLCKNKEITVDASNTNGLLSPQPPKEAIEPLAEIKEEPMESYRKSPEYVIRPHPPPLQAPQAPPTNGIALNLSLPTSSDKPQDRRASFSSSGQDEPSTDSEAETGLVNKLQAERYQCNQCPQVLKDLKSLQIHQFVDHHHDANAGNSPRLIAPPPAPVQAPPPVQHYRQHVPVQPQPTRSFPPPNPPHFTNGLIGSREGSISSDSGEGGPVSPVLRCELCGLSNFSSTKALQQHIFSHAQARPHVCPRCDAGFATLHQLDAHMKLH